MILVQSSAINNIILMLLEEFWRLGAKPRRHAPDVWVHGLPRLAAIPCNPLLFAFVGIDKVVGREAGLSDCTAKSSDGKFLMDGNNTAFVLFA